MDIHWCHPFSMQCVLFCHIGHCVSIIILYSLEDKQKKNHILILLLLFYALHNSKQTLREEKFHKTCTEKIKIPFYSKQ